MPPICDGWFLTPIKFIMLMLKFKIPIYLLILLFFANAANAATIHGTVYDLSLKKLNNAKVEIDTSPKQVFIAQNGSYAFNVPNGAYMIKAQLMQKNTVIASVEENITIRQPGDYVLDLILFPEIEEGVEDIDIDVNENVIGTKNNIFIMVFISVFILISVLAALYYSRKTKQKKEAIKDEKAEQKEKYEGNDLNKIIEILKKESGRATQKEIRKQIPLSEAKISLMIAELEHKGIIKKIKKGRGNIIILKKS